MNKHTKGEWIIEPNNEIQLAISVNNRALAFLPLLHTEVEANAKLIAAAPDLLEALIEIKKLAQCSDDRFANYSDLINELTKAAIKKATE